MEQWIMETMSNFGYLGIFLLIALENLFPPLPSELILSFGGFMTTSTELTIIGIILASTAGSLTGAIALYGLGRLMPLERQIAFVARYGKFLRLKPDDIRKAHAWFDKYGIWAVLIGRVIPLIRSLISIPAGSTRMRLLPFLLFTTLGSLVWNTFLVTVGATVGSSWESIVDYMNAYSSVVYAIIALVGAGAIAYIVRRRKAR
ncbi:membrane protein DedA with SNARE-associated domain [Paenibacillus phyllosphaerae]|uniref:Membrane protein DedA with SNARE-associated domain n=1 Tax=Paenibacillus phyllosphaerae TaxID=274593 RepID=A0A7W5FPM3_9BACL|nr:DedA family protein [Paenibacillus phyllosphaerae]MBB3112377.1 membrane protein DedA with SNARE-associated domain [Paenibacillus phyllosphaerae]